MRVLADGKIKFTLLTTEPANPDAPTAAELNAGIDASCKVTADNFVWSARDSDKIGEAALCDESNAQAYTRSNYEASFQVWREYLAGGGIDPTADALFEAVKFKGTELWGYIRKSDKKATEPWATGDEIPLGMRISVDTPQMVDGGYIKYLVKAEPQRGWPFIEVAAV